MTHSDWHISVSLSLVACQQLFCTQGSLLPPQWRFVIAGPSSGFSVETEQWVSSKSKKHQSITQVKSSQVSQVPRFSQGHKSWPSREPKMNSSRTNYDDLSNQKSMKLKAWLTLIVSHQVLLICLADRHTLQGTWRPRLSVRQKLNFKETGPSAMGFKFPPLILLNHCHSLTYQTGFRVSWLFTNSRTSRPQATGNVAASGMELSMSESNVKLANMEVCWFCPWCLFKFVLYYLFN